MGDEEAAEKEEEEEGDFGWSLALCLPNDNNEEADDEADRCVVGVTDVLAGVTWNSCEKIVSSWCLSIWMGDGLFDGSGRTGSGRKGGTLEKGDGSEEEEATEEDEDDDTVGDDDDDDDEDDDAREEEEDVVTDFGICIITSKSRNFCSELVPNAEEDEIENERADEKDEEEREEECECEPEQLPFFSSNAIESSEDDPFISLASSPSIFRGVACSF